MEQTLHALGGLLLKAVPTFLLVVLLHFYLKRLFFRPMDKVLRERHAATEGARRIAEESLEMAARKTAEYEQAVRAARADIYKEQEEIRRQWRQEQAQAVQKERRRSGEMVSAARAQLTAEAEAAKHELAAESDRLAARIVESILKEGRN